MKVAVFSTKKYDREFLEMGNKGFGHELTYFEAHLSRETSRLAGGFDAVCVFVNDIADKEVIHHLSEAGVRLIALRCAGFNQVDVKAAHQAGIKIARVPAYSPHGVAEHAVALMLAVNRKISRAYNRVREGNFSLEGLMGFEIHGLTAGVIGTGKIGVSFARIMKGFGCKVLGSDPSPSPEAQKAGVEYVELFRLFRESDIVSLHAPLTRQTRHLINAESVARMKDGVMLINTSRGGLIDTRAVIEGLKSGKIGSFGLDVYEEEGDVFFEDLSSQVLQDDVLARLLTFPNVVMTGHQAFFTSNAMRNITEMTLKNISDFAQGKLPKENEVTLDYIK